MMYKSGVSPTTAWARSYQIYQPDSTRLPRRSSQTLDILGQEIRSTPIVPLSTSLCPLVAREMKIHSYFPLTFRLGRAIVSLSQFLLVFELFGQHRLTHQPQRGNSSGGSPYAIPIEDTTSPSAAIRPLLRAIRSNRLWR